MVDWKKLQKDVYQNKVNHHFNVTDPYLEFCLLYGELGEAFNAFNKKKPDLGEELADVAIYLLGLSEILGIDLEDQVLKKMEINQHRRYELRDGVMQKVEE